MPESSISALAAIGYEFRGDGSVAGRLYFRKGAPRSHHVHIALVGSEFWDRHILFRNFLRAHPTVVKKYGILKRSLANKFRNDRIAYTDAKDVFIQDALTKARPEAVSLEIQLP